MVRDSENQSDELVRSAVIKAAWRILPLLGLGYLFSFMDRVNIGFAALEMNAELGFSATVFGFGAGIFFLSLAIFEIPSILVMPRFGARRWLARMMITWGLCATATMFVRTPWQFYTVRFLLGISEAGYFAVVIYYFSSWFPRSVRGRTISFFYVFGPFASVVIGGISGSMLAMNGLYGLHGWQWLLLLQGMPAVLLGLTVWRLLPDDPGSASWLTSDESAALQRVLAHEADAMGPPAHEGFFATLRNPAVVQLALIGALTVGTGITLSVNLPLLLKDTASLDDYQIGFATSAGGILGIFGMLSSGILSDRVGERFVPALICMLGSAVGIALLLVQFSTATSIAGVLVLSFFGWAQALLFAALWPDLLHPGLLALGGAIIDTVSQIGAFIGPYGWGAAKDATGTYSLALTGLVLTMLTAAGLVGLLMHHTKRGRSRSMAIDKAEYDSPLSLSE